MASTQVNPTRMELTKQKKKLKTAVRGHKLLKDKRDELMRQFLDLVRENMELRLKVEAGIRSANTNFVIAKAGMSEQTLKTALMTPKQEVYLDVDKKNVMSVDIPVIECSLPNGCSLTITESKVSSLSIYTYSVELFFEKAVKKK